MKHKRTALRKYCLFIVVSGGRQADDIVAWVLKKTGPPAKELKSVEEAKEFIDASNVAVVGFFKDQTSDNAKAFLAAAAAIDDQPFAITSDDAIFKEYEASCGNIILFKKVRVRYQNLYQHIKLTWSCDRNGNVPIRL